MATNAIELERERKVREDEWKAKRRTCVPSTLLPAVMGLPGAYGSRMSAYLHCKNLVEESEEEDETLVWGKLLQRPILIRYAEKIGEPIEFADEYEFLVSPGCKYLGASLDGRWMNKDRRPVDAKNIGFREPYNGNTGEGYGEDFSDEIPSRYVVQLTAQMDVTGSSIADLAVLFGGRQQGIFRVIRDEEVVLACQEAAARFMEEHVLRDIPPAVDGSDEWTRFLASRRAKYADYRQVASMPAEERDQILADYEALRAVKAALKEGKAKESLHGNRLRAAIGEHSGLILPDGSRIHFKCNKDGIEEDVEAELRALADLAKVDLETFRAQFRKPKPGARPLLLPRE